jgi:predicted Zn-dependent protease with MMP-like domain
MEPRYPDPEGNLDFDAVIDDAVDELPEVFAAQLGSVAIVVEEEPTQAQLASVRAPGLFGIYEGVPRTRWGADGAAIPSKITLFRGPLSRAYRDPTRLATAIRDTLHHEIAHHFGIDDDRLRELRHG